MIRAIQHLRSQGIFLGIGSNMGDRRSAIIDAVALLASGSDCRLVRGASIYETAPIGNVQQDYFYNTVVEVETAMEPDVLLARAQEVENTMGRVRGERWGPRVIDIDLLYYHQQCIETGVLTVPHPEIGRRRFVLDPLTEIAGDFLCPVRRVPIRDIAKPADQTISIVERWTIWQPKAVLQN